MAKSKETSTMSEEIWPAGDGSVPHTVEAGATDSGNGEVKKTRKPRVTLESKGLANLPVSKSTYDLLAKAGKAVDMTAHEFFAAQYGADFEALLAGHLQKDGAPIPSLRDRLTAALSSKVDATLGEIGL